MLEDWILRKKEIEDSKKSLQGADLCNAKLMQAKLNGASLEDADLTAAYLIKADLSGANLSRADLTQAVLSEADLSGVDFEDTELELLSPRDATKRGSHVALSHPNAEGVIQDMKKRGVLGDYRPPDLLRFGFSPLYTRYTDVWDATTTLREILI